MFIYFLTLLRGAYEKRGRKKYIYTQSKFPFSSCPHSLINHVSLEFIQLDIKS